MPQKQALNSPFAPFVPSVEAPQDFLRLGSQGLQVSALQSRLKTLHPEVGEVDGHFGPKTFAAVTAFQRSRGLVPDGVVGPKTAGALGLHLSSPRTPSAPVANKASANDVEALVEKFSSRWSTDEKGLAQALYNRGADAHFVIAAFRLLDAEYTSDSDDVALQYVALVRSRQGPALEMLKKERALRNLLIDCLAAGVVFPDEDAQIQFLRGLAGPTPVPSGGSQPHPGIEIMVQAALAQKGKKYVYGAEVAATNRDAKAFDCSELVEWAAAQAGAKVPDGSQNQRAHCREKKTIIPVEEAIRTRGALLFTKGHVAISLGNGMTIEAANKEKGVCSQKATDRGWVEAGLVPDFYKGGVLSRTPQRVSSAKAVPTPKTAPASNKVASAATGDGTSGNVINGYVLYPNEVRGEGTIAWRNNNPGNIRNGAFANAHGAFKGKHNRHFAIFPNHATGFAALIELLKTQQYQTLSVTAAMKRYVPASDDNDPVAYARTLSKKTGVDVNRLLSSLSSAELQKFAAAIQQVEGWKAGVVYSRRDPRLAGLGIQSADVSAPSVAATTPASQGTKQTSSSQTAVRGSSAPALKLPATAHQETLRKLGQQARERMHKKNLGLCAKGVCEMLSAVGYGYGLDRPYVSSGIVGKVYDYGTGQWIAASTKGYYVSKHSHLDKKTELVTDDSHVKCAAASDSARFMKHTLELLKFIECTALLRGHGSLGAPPQQSVETLRSLPEGAIVVFGPALSRSVLKQAGKSYKQGGAGHAGHVGVLLREGNEVLVVADGLLTSNGGKYTVEMCLSSYAWAVGFIPTTAPFKASSKDRVQSIV
ncbi:hypothetical protein HJC10_26600 [Corallococcus exiguus]|nr:hypothetical protein [Corallococcus exiguus]